MRSFSLQKVSIALVVLALLLVCLLVVELLIVKFNGTPVPAPNIPRGPETYGSGSPLTYVVLGDSTTISQGGDYDRGIARETARFLGRNHTVTLYNLGVSGARTADVLERQLPEAIKLQPDVVLLDVTANDVTHLTSISAVRRDLLATVRALREANPKVEIVVTGAPAMGSVPRFPEPIKSLARYRTAQINRMVRPVAEQEGLRFAPIAERTGKAFLERPELFAADKFHPTTKGYQLWVNVLNDTLQQTYTR